MTAYKTLSATSSGCNASIPEYTASALSLSPAKRTMENSVLDTRPGAMWVTLMGVPVRQR